MKAAFFATMFSLVPIVNPIGNLPVFFALTAKDTPRFRHRQAAKASFYVFAILTTSAVAGRPILHALGISIAALQIAGGLIVGHAAFGMVTGAERLTRGEQNAAVDKEDVSFTPMAMPLLSGPGAIGVVIALSSRLRGPGPTFGIVTAIFVTSLIVFVALRLGEQVLARMGRNGISALSRISGFLILAIAVELVAHGVLELVPGLTR